MKPHPSNIDASPSTPGGIEVIQKLANPPLPKESAPPAVFSDGAWGAIEDIDSTDLLIPKIYHQQAMSKLVADGKARPGDWCDSLTGEVLAKKEDKLEVIIFGLFRTMVISKYDAATNRWGLSEIIAINRGNAHNYASVPYVEETKEGKFKNNLYYNYYCLIPSKLNDLPYVLSLGSTKTKVAKKLNTMLAKLDQMRQLGTSIVFELRSTSEKNDRGSWAGVEITQGRVSNEEERKAAQTWYMKSKTQSLTASEDSSDADSTSEDNISF